RPGLAAHAAVDGQRSRRTDDIPSRRQSFPAGAALGRTVAVAAAAMVLASGARSPARLAAGDTAHAADASTAGRADRLRHTAVLAPAVLSSHVGKPVDHRSALYAAFTGRSHLSRDIWAAPSRPALALDRRPAQQRLHPVVAGGEDHGGARCTLGAAGTRP